MSVRFRLMTIEDIPEAMQLKDSAGWNQTTAGWARFLSASPEGCLVAEREGRVVGTSTSIIYESRFAWIGMVILKFHEQLPMKDSSILAVDGQSLRAESCRMLEHLTGGCLCFAI
jgi:hypothetical protein